MGIRARLAAATILGVATVARGAAPAWDLWQAAGPPPATRTIQHDLRAAVVLPLPVERAFPVTIPPHATLALGYALAAAAPPERPAAGRVRIALAVGDDPPMVLHERAVDPAARPLDARWTDLRLDLGRLAGVTGRLTISADGGDAALLLSAARLLVDAAADEPNVLLVTIDCLRADHLGAYGYARPTSPALDALAADGIRFAHALANAPMTMPSMPQLYASRLFPLPSDPTVLGAFARAGIPTAAIVNNAWITLWLAQVRDAAAEPLDRVLIADGWNASRVTDAALSWIDGHGGARWALHLHYLDVHSPYLLYPSTADRFGDPAYRGPVTAAFDDVAGARQGRYDAADQARVVSLYDAGIRYVDDQFGRLFAQLRASGALDRTIVVVTADHGEELWDHGAFFHGQSLHDELLHVPLLVRLPGGARGGTVVDAPVQLLDVAPSLLDWAGLPAAPSFDGRRLRDVAGNADAPSPPLIATAVNAQFPIRYGVRTATHALAEHLGAARRSLFDRGTDPGERSDRAAADPAAVASLAAALEAARAPLHRRGVQVRVVADGVHLVALRLDDPRDGRFTTLDRLGPFGAVRVAATHMGRGARAKGVVRGTAVGFRFDRRPPPLPSPLASDPVHLAAVVDGRVAADGTMVAGADAHTIAAGELDVRDPRLVATTEPACTPPPGGVRICVWRAADDGAAAATPDLGTRDRLRALGYAP